MLTSSNTIIALDIGAKRIGVAIANAAARIAHPETTIENHENTVEELQALIRQHNAAILVCGLPRGLEGQHTAQTSAVQAFVAQLQQHITLPLYWQDEAVTSRQAETELRAKGKLFKKGDIDALAATYILEDFLADHPEVAV